MHRGRCLCGDISFVVRSALNGASVCHCTQCRRQSGHLWASAQAPETDVEITGPVAWFRASPSAKRGFCPSCGAFLFWAADAEPMISVAPGALDAPTGLRLEKHIFTAERGDYYRINDGVPQS